MDKPDVRSARAITHADGEGGGSPAAGADSTSALVGAPLETGTEPSVEEDLLGPFADRRQMFIMVRYMLIAGVSALAIVTAHGALPSHQAMLVAWALASNVVLGRLPTSIFFRWWVQGPLVLMDTVWIAVVMLSAGFTQQYFLFYFIQLFLVAISESLGLLALGAILIGSASVALGGEGVLTSATLVRVPFFFATAVFFGYVLDMTKQERRWGRQRALWAKRLETEVRIRTRELERQGADLHRLYEEARAADQLKSEFVANMSHELRTPIHIIMGYAELAMENLGPSPLEDVRNFLERITDRARDLHRLVEGVLDYANLERGRVTLKPRRFRIDSLLADLQSLCSDIPRSSEVTVQFDAAPGLEVTTDYDRLRSVLSNIVINGLKFTPAGSVRLAVRETNGGIELAVHDTGIGIPPEALGQIFEPFRQVDGSTTRHFGGVGLGLAIVQRNLKLLEGRIQVDSQVGQGSTFRVSIPHCLGGGDESAGAAGVLTEVAA